MLKIVKKMLKIGDFQHFFNFFFNIFFSTFFCIFELALQCSFKWSLVSELFLYKLASYRGFTAAKTVHLITKIVMIKKIDTYIFTCIHLYSLDPQIMYSLVFTLGKSLPPLFWRDFLTALVWELPGLAVAAPCPRTTTLFAFFDHLAFFGLYFILYQQLTPWWYFCVLTLF